MKETKTLEAFTTSLVNLDWFYNMSDDHAAYTRGREAMNSARLEAEANGPEWVQAFKNERENHIAPAIESPKFS